MQQIITRAEEVAVGLPNDFGRGGKVGGDTFKSLDESTKKVFEARIQAPQPLGDDVDDIVSDRYITPRIKREIDEVYSTNDKSKGNSFRLRVLGHLSSYISGSIIMLLKDVV